MMVSFLAALEGVGVAFEGEEIARAGTLESKGKEGGGKLSLPGISSLLGIDLSGRLQSASKEEESKEMKVLRRHTEASLFNLLRHRLIAESRVEKLSGKIGNPAPGALVEVEGEYSGNALQQLVDFFLQILPYAGLDDDEGEAKKKKNPRKSGNPAVRAQATGAQDTKEDEVMPAAEIVRLMKLVRDDLGSSAVEDAVVEIGDNQDVVLALSREFLSDETRDQMLASRVRVIGKVARVLTEDDEINLMRRSAVGAAGPELARSLVEDFTAAEGIHLDLGEPVISAPGMQIQPLAVFL